MEKKKGEESIKGKAPVAAEGKLEEVVQNFDPSYPKPDNPPLYEGSYHHDEEVLRKVFSEIYGIPFPDFMVNWMAFGNLDKDPQGSHYWAGHILGTIPQENIESFIESLEQVGIPLESANGEMELGKLYRRLPKLFEGNHQGLGGLDGFIPGSTFKHGFVMKLDHAEVSIGFYLDHSTGSLWIRFSNDYDNS